MVAVRVPLLHTTEQILSALKSERNTFAASNVMDAAHKEIGRLRRELDYAYRCVSSGYNQGVFDFSVLKDRALAHVRNEE